MDGPTTRLRLRVAPGASKPGVVGRHGESWKVRVAAAPENGRANAAVVQLLAQALAVAEADVEIVGGRSSRDKVVALHGISSREVDERLNLAVSARA